jgi:hypothetical protein
MQLKCTFCNSMFNIGNDEAAAVATKFHDNEIAHYDAHCPKCHRSQKVTRDQFVRGFPALRKVAENKE